MIRYYRHLFASSVLYILNLLEDFAKEEYDLSWGNKGALG